MPQKKSGSGRSSEAAKATRARSYARGAARKAARRKRGEELHAARLARYAAGEQTERDLAWDDLKARMRQKRERIRDERRAVAAARRGR